MELLDGRWGKNDTKNAANVADLVSLGKCQYYDLPNLNLRDICSLLVIRKKLTKQQHSIRVRIRNNLVAQYFPELERLWSQAETENLGIVRWCLALEKISRLKLEDYLRMVGAKVSR